MCVWLSGVGGYLSGRHKSVILILADDECLPDANCEILCNFYFGEWDHWCLIDTADHLVHQKQTRPSFIST